MAGPDRESEKESEVWNAIAAFEQILEAMPDDRVALESLYEAYLKIGDQASARKYLLRLARVVINERDEKAAQDMVKRLKESEASDKETEQLIKELTELAGQKEVAPAAPRSRVRHKPVGITAELSLAWKLLEAGHIQQDEYDTIVKDLSENSAKQLNTPVTVLHVLEDRQFRHANSILAFISRDSGLPVIPLSRFEIPPECFQMLPMEIMEHRGAIVFDTMGRDVLVAILNPYDADLRREVEEATKRKCHFFLTPAAEYDAALADIRAKIAAENEGKE
ncbi:MAG: hypothetical protein DRP22_03840 [Verrucomicrobia bacterium]|nr:MAG: hypothetical protein DRP22_03840 [Verrucomicrobiota bacterium]